MELIKADKPNKSPKNTKCERGIKWRENYKAKHIKTQTKFGHIKIKLPHSLK